MLKMFWFGVLVGVLRGVLYWISEREWRARTSVPAA